MKWIVWNVFESRLVALVAIVQAANENKSPVHFVHARVGKRQTKVGLGTSYLSLGELLVASTSLHAHSCE